MQPSFVHLRFHSEFSVTDGIVRLKNAIATAKGWGSPALGITDLMNTFAGVRFYEGCIKSGIKPILGCDLRVSNPDRPSRPHRITVLCMNHEGYHSLCVLLSRAWLENQVEKGRGEVREEWLAGGGSEGLICLVGGPESEPLALLAEKREDDALMSVERISALFPSRFYLDLQRAGRPGDEEGVRFLCGVAARLALPVVATHPVQFQEKRDFTAHEVRVCIAEGLTLDDRKRPRLYSDEQYLKSPEEMAGLFADIPPALENTVEIAKRCSVDGILSGPQLPLFETPPGMTLDDYIEDLSRRGLEERLKFLYPDPAARDAARPRYSERLEYELGVIEKMRFQGYFLIVQEFINWSKQNGIPVGPGRGSGAGSLVAYSLRITDIDPLHYNLLFERFLNPERVSMPDFDVDFCQWNRDRTIQHVKDKYGAEAVSQVATFGAMGAKAVVRDVGRVLGMPYGKVDDLAKLIPIQPGVDMTLKMAKETEPDFKAMSESDEQYQRLMGFAEQLEGITRNIGMHAGGVLIAPGPVTNFCPVYNQDGAPENTVSQYDKHDIEKVGLIKFDFLGLTNLTVINKCVEYVRRLRPELDFDIERIPTDDKETLELFQRGDTTAVFQFESPGMRQLLRQAHPDKIEDLVALNALYRPGPMEMIPTYLARKSGAEPVTYPDERMSRVLKETYGIMVYQEQVMQVAQIIGGYTLGGADLLRRAMGKKLRDEMVRQRGIFVAGAEKNGVAAPVANEIFDLMAKFAGYGFNKSHAVAYSYVAYETAYLKCHHPAAFLAANMCLSLTDSDKLWSFARDCAACGISILPPDVNRSEWFFFPTDERTIRFGLGGVKGVGKGIIDSLVEEREENGPYLDLFDLCARLKERDNNGLTKKVLDGLIRAGAFDSLDPDRGKLFANIDQAMKAAADTVAFKDQGSLFGDDDGNQERIVNWVASKPWSLNERLIKEKEAVGFCLTGHLFDEYRDEVRQSVGTTIREFIESIPRPRGDEQDQRRGRGRGDTVRVAGIVMDLRQVIGKKGRMGIVTLDDGTAEIEAVCYSDAWEQYRGVFEKDSVAVVTGHSRWDERKETAALSIDTAEDIATLRRNRGAALLIELEDGASARELAKAMDQVLDKSGNGLPIVFEARHRNLRGRIAAGRSFTVEPTNGARDIVSHLRGVDKVAFEYD